MLDVAHPTKLNHEAVLQAARHLLEEHGPDGLTMRAIGRDLGVAAPSLYFHVESRDDLLRILTTEGLLEFGEHLGDATAGEPDPGRRIHLMADAYAEFAAEHPQLFVLLFGPCPEDRLVDPAVAADASEPLLSAIAELVPQERVLSISQALWSLAHGYATLSLAAQFRLGGTPKEAMHEAIDLLLAGLRVAEPPPAR